MDINKWENEIQNIRAKNGWIIEFECNGLWIITIRDKETGAFIASTGTTGLDFTVDLLNEELDSGIWILNKEIK